jgi:hypothetical protein
MHVKAKPECLAFSITSNIQSSKNTKLNYRKSMLSIQCETKIEQVLVIF